MSIESVRAFFEKEAPDIAVIESSMSSATVPLAAEAYGVKSNTTDLLRYLPAALEECAKFPDRL